MIEIQDQSLVLLISMPNFSRVENFSRVVSMPIAIRAIASVAVEDLSRPSDETEDPVSVFLLWIAPTCKRKYGPTFANSPSGLGYDESPHRTGNP